MNVINVKNLQEIVVWIRWHEDQILKTVDNPRLDKLEEDVVAALVGLLVGHAGLLEEVDIDETTGKFAHVVEIDPAPGWGLVSRNFLDYANLYLMNFPKREELSFLMVLALPYDSKMGFVLTILSSRLAFLT